MSRRRDEEKWGPHTHCIICGNPIPEDQKTCSDACAQKYEADVKKYKRQQKMSYLLLFGMGAVILVLVLLPYLLGR